MIHAFGDSWCAGAELTAHDKTFVQVLADNLNCKWGNHGKNGSSLGEILQTIVEHSGAIHNNDLVLVVVPPDVRWYTKQHAQYKTISAGERQHFLMFDDVDPSWFSDHHKQFIFTIQSIIRSQGADCIMQHNYGTLVPHTEWDQLIDWQCWIDPNQSLTELLGGEKWDNLNDNRISRPIDRSGPWSSCFTGKYFEGCEYHPNALGHSYIAELIFNKLKDKN